MPVKVELRKNESVEKLLTRFKKTCSKEGIVREVRQRAYYEKPSACRRRKNKERAKNRRKHDKQQSDTFQRKESR